MHAVICTNCISGKSEELVFSERGLISRRELEETRNTDLFLGPGLMDLQINGINGIDFNTPSLKEEDFKKAARYLLSQGITTFFPTVISNSDNNLLTILRTIHSACLTDPLVNDCVGGVHLEGPFISPVPGARGAHDEAYIQPPDWDLFSRYQEAAGGKIRLITLAPEREGSTAFIQKCRAQKILVAIGHSMATADQIRTAVKAGATLSTHLGNGVPLLLPRHPNIIWDQLATEELSACIITDGIHLPDSFIKTVLKTKGKATLIVSDATCFAGMPPGEYQSHIGGSVVVDSEKRVSFKTAPGLLAGAAKSLLENVETLIDHHITGLGQAWEMASTNVRHMLVRGGETSFTNYDDNVLFQLDGSTIHVKTVIKKGVVVFEL